jgi:FtsZ-interacting cell division protein YlmF
MAYKKIGYRDDSLDSKLSYYWLPITTNDLWLDLIDGTEAYMDQVDESINKTWQEELANAITSWFQVSSSELDPKFLKKLTNVTLAAGKQGFTRTCESLEDWNVFKNFDQTRNRMEILVKNSPRSRAEVISNFNESTRCRKCDKSFKDNKYVVHQPSMLRNETRDNLHFLCFVANLLRINAREYRNTKGGFYKQAKATRQILFAQRGREDFRSSKKLMTFVDFENWRQELIQDWTKETSVKKDYWDSYAKDFIDCTNQVLDAKLDPKYEFSYFRSKLRRHVESQNFESKIFSYLQSAPSASGFFTNNSVNKSADFSDGTVQVDTLKIAQLSQLSRVSEKLSQNISVIIDISPLGTNQIPRFIDIITGVIYGSGLKIQRISKNTYFLCKPNVSTFGTELPQVTSSSSEKAISDFFRSN